MLARSVLMSLEFPAFQSWWRSRWRQKLMSLAAVMLLSSTSLTGCSLPEVTAESRLFSPVTLEFVDDYTLPPTLLKDVPVGGLSGLTYDPKSGGFYAISDDRSGFSPARFYSITPKIGTDKKTGNLKIKTVEIIAKTALSKEDGKPYDRNQIDPEGIALSPRGTVFISTEGDARSGLAPAINEYDLTTGALIQALPIPDIYKPKKGPNGVLEGVQNNKGFESLAINTDATGDLFRVFAAIEHPLEQDRNPPPAPPKSPSPDAPPESPVPIPPDRLRMLHYAATTGRTDLVGEYVYELDPAPIGTLEHGLSEILALDNAGRFLALERSLGLAGFSAKLYQFTFAGAQDVQSMSSLRGLPADWQAIRKRLMLDLTQIGVKLDNLEGMTFGPRLPDGSQSLWIVSDDNFDKDQNTQFLLFRIKAGEAETEATDSTASPGSPPPTPTVPVPDKAPDKVLAPNPAPNPTVPSTP
jgi:hypothetical protein